MRIDYGPNMIREQRVCDNQFSARNEFWLIQGCRGFDVDQGGELMIAVWKSCRADLKESHHGLLRSHIRSLRARC